MNDDLTQLLRDRAGHARRPHDPEKMVELITSRAEERSRRRRGHVAVASGTLVLAATAAVGIAVFGTGTADTGSQAPAGGQRPASRADVQRHSSSGARWVVSSDGKRYVLRRTDGAGSAIAVPSATHGTVTIPSMRSQAQQRAHERRAAEQQAREARAAQKLAAEARDAGGSLHPADPAPKQAEISIGLLPKGFGYLSHDDANTYYGLPGTTSQDYFSDGIVVDVHQFIGDAKDYTLMVDGKPASYGRSGGTTIVRVLYSKHVDVGFQAPPSARLTKQQALKMAASLDVRSTQHRTHG